jgi:type VI secretion system protein ImpL
MNSWQVQQLKFAFGIGGLMSFYGIIGFLTFTVGPSLGLSLNQRVMVIVVLLLTLPFTLLVGYLATRRSKKKEEEAKQDGEAKTGDAKAEEKAATGDQPQKAATPTGTYQDLPGGAEEVVKFLQTSNLGGAGNAKDAIYTLPWYIVAGSPRSGKSSLVLGSNLNFQTLPSQRQSEQKMIRPTRNIDWRVTSDAVFVDTAGRYQTEGADEDEWNSLLETIKKYRSNRPIDGMLFVADTEKILNSDERQIEEMAKVMRTRIDEAMQRLKVRFPVYLIFTHADSIEGFRDSFSTSKKEGETLVWGATIPLEKSDTAHAMFDEEYGLLHNAVMKRRLMRLSAPFPPVRQLRIFNFPLHFGAARRKLGAFVAALFRPNPFSENPFLRGYYFTAAPAGRQQQQEAQGEKTMSGTPSPMTVGYTYFTEKFFRDVVLRDKDLVRTFLEQRQKPPILGWLLTLLGAALVFIFLILVAVSLVNNQKLLAASADKGSAVLNIAKADGNVSPLSKAPDAATREVNAIEDLRVLMVELDDYDRNGAPIYLGMGLYSGNSIYKGDEKTKGLLNIYYNAIGRRYMDPTVRRLEDELRKFAAAPPVNSNTLNQQEEDVLSRNYDLLKVYLMLSDKYRDKSNDTDIVNALKEFWFAESKLPAGLKDDAENQLKFYAKQADRLEGPDKFPRIQNDMDLVAQVRKKLLAFPPHKRYYKRKVTEISKEIEAKYGEMTVDAILQRRGGDGGYLEGVVAVPGAYTIEGFKLMNVAILASAQELSGSDWVMSDDKNVVENVTGMTENANKIREQYFRDYADRWREFVKNVKVKPYRKETDSDNSKVSAKDALSSFSSANSPIKVLFKEIARNTNLSAKPKPTGWWETIKGWFKSETLPDTGGASQVVEREFRPLFGFVEGDKSTKIDEYQTLLSQVYIKYNGFDDAKINEIASVQDDEKNKQFPQLNDSSSKIDAATKPLKDAKDSAVSPFFAEILRQPLGNLKALLSADSLKQLADRWANEILPAAKLAEQGYPFVQGENNADFANLKAYLAPSSGKLSQFFTDNNLQKKYFEGDLGQLKLKDPANSPFRQEFVDYLNKAFTLRKALFGKGDDVKFEYNFELTNPKDTVVEMVIDGTTVSSVDKPSLLISFPGTSGGTGVTIKLLSTSSTTSTSGTTTSSANTSTSSVNSNSSSNSAVTTSTPVPVQNNNSTASTDEKPFPGPWGLFRFIRDANGTKQSDNSYLLSYKLKSGKTLTAKITPQGVDPFDREIYKLQAPETILK